MTIKKNKNIEFNPNEINLSFSKWSAIMQEKYSSSNMMVDLIKCPVITEKSYFALFKNKQYTFDVDLRLTKSQIKKLFEKLFEVNIIGINTHRPPRRKVRLGLAQGYRPRYKRVILTLKEGQSMNFFKFDLEVSNTK